MPLTERPNPRRFAVLVASATVLLATILAGSHWQLTADAAGQIGSIGPSGAGASQTAGRLTPPRPQYPTAASSGVPGGVALTSWPWALRTSAASVPTEVKNGRTCQVFYRYLVSLSGGSYLSVDTPCAIFRQSRFVTSGAVSNGSALLQQGNGNAYLEVTSSDFDGGPSYQRGVQGDQADLVVTFSKFARFGEAGVEMNNRSGTASLTVEDSYFYEAPGWPGSYHVDGIQVGAGKNVSIRRNTVLIEPWGGTPGQTSYVSNSALGIWAELGDVKGTVIVDSNLLAGGGYAVYVQQSGPYVFRGAVFVTNNVFDQRFSGKCGIWGPLYTRGIPSGLQWLGNAFSSGAPLSLALALTYT